jgi:hypothetical protein
MSARLPSSQPHPRSGNHRAAESPPVGLKRVLHRLPFAVLTCENYRRLVELLADPGTGKAAGPAYRDGPQRLDHRGNRQRTGGAAVCSAAGPPGHRGGSKPVVVDVDANGRSLQIGGINSQTELLNQANLAESHSG